MRLKDIFRRTVLLLLLFAGTGVVAQNPFSLYYEPEIEVEFSSSKRWAHSFGVSNRNSFFTYEEGEKISSTDLEHLELNHYTGYRLTGDTKISLGLRYRWREVFDDTRHDEFRIIEQFEYEQPRNHFYFDHRIRLEQRFRDEFSFRARYQFGIVRPLGDEFGVGLATEFVYSMSKSDKPEAEQRFSIEFENYSFPNLELSAGVEYRLDNFNISVEEELFVSTGAILDLD